MDEQPIELRYDSRETIHEYFRNGTCCGFMFTVPHECWRRVSIREHRCKTDWAQEIKQLVAEDFPDAEKTVLVCDKLLDTESGGSQEVLQGLPEIVSGPASKSPLSVICQPREILYFCNRYSINTTS